MKAALAAACLCLLCLGAAGCMGGGEASQDDKANIQRLTKEGMTPKSTGQQQGEPGVPLSGKVEDP